MDERLRFENELADIGLRERETWGSTRIPIVMFEFDIHYGFRPEIDKLLGQKVPLSTSRDDIHITKHDKKQDFFNVKRDVFRMELGTERFALDSAGLANIETAKRKIKKWTDHLKDGFDSTSEDKTISINDSNGNPIAGHPRLFLLPHRRKKYDAVKVHKLPLAGRFPTDGRVWASPQAHVTIPLSKVEALVAIIKRSTKDDRPGHTLSGHGSMRMGVKSDPLYKAVEQVHKIKKRLLEKKPTLSDGTVVDETTFSDALTGFLILQASYLWIAKLADPKKDTEPFGKAHIPLHVKTPFPEIYNDYFTATEQRMYRELFAEGNARTGMWFLAGHEKKVSVDLGKTRLFPTVVWDDHTWDDLLDWTLGLTKPWQDKLPGFLGKVWHSSEAKPLVALELRRIGYKPLYVEHWPTLIDTIVKHTTKLNQ